MVAYTAASSSTAMARLRSTSKMVKPRRRLMSVAPFTATPAPHPTAAHAPATLAAATAAHTPAAALAASATRATSAGTTGATGATCTTGAATTRTPGAATSGTSGGGLGLRLGLSRLGGLDGLCVVVEVADPLGVEDHLREGHVGDVAVFV